jgi:hypothetical protein
LVDLSQEGHEFSASVTLGHAPEHLARGDVESGIETGRAEVASRSV